MRKSAVAIAVGLAFATDGGRALALPEGGQVTAGQGSIGTPANGSLTVTQQSNRMAIDWQRFGIRAGESVHFAQPNPSSIVLNRVIGNEASQIYGRLSANGQVFLLNPNGVLFAPGSQVNVGGLVASTLKLSKEDFMAGRYVFSKGEKAGSVVNQGEITAGYAALLGAQAINEGIITATLGTVALAAGEQITLNLNGTSLVGLTVDKGALDALAANKQLIRADGGTVLLTAKATDDLIRNVVNNDGIIEARTISQRDGVIRLESTGSGITAVDGALTAKSITVTGDKVGLFDNARLTAPSGTILVGGNFQGKGPERNSSATYVAPVATLNADGVGEGDGGRVIVWSDGITAFYGHLSAKGGPLGGDGGFAEISGKESLIVSGSIDLTAPRGQPGSILFDPKNITIEHAGLGLLSDAALFGTVPGNNVSIDADVITSVTNSGVAVTLQASNNITVDEAVITNNASGNGGNLTLQAGHSILVNADIVTDNGNLTLVANETLANGVVDAQREAGAAVITFTSASVNAGSGTVNITMSGGGPGKTNPNTGDITLGGITAATLNVTNAGPDSATSHIALNGTLTISGATSVNSGGGAVNLAANLSTDVLSITGALNHTAGTLSVTSGSISGLYDFSSSGGLSIGAGTLTLNGGMDWSGSGTISGVNSTLSRLSIPGGDTVVISDGNRSLSSITYSNAGTTQISLPAGNSLSVPLGAVIENHGLFEFVADQNSVSAGGVFSNIGGTVRNSSAGTNSISLTSGFIGSTDGSFWEASTGRLNLDAGAGSGNFNDTTNIVGNGVHFTGGTFQFFNFMPSADQINGTVNLSGATFDVQTNSLAVNGPVNLGADTTVTLNTNSIVFQNTINGANDLAITGSGAGTITFNGAIGGTTPLQDLSIATAQALALPQTTLTGNLDVSAGGNISQTGRAIVPGTTSLATTTGSIQLNQGANDFGGAVSVSSPFGGVLHWIADRNDLVLGTINIVASDLLVQTGMAQSVGLPAATGNLSQTGPLTEPIEVQTYGTSSNILLGAANDINDADPFVLSNPGGGAWGNVTLRNTNMFASALRLNDNNGWTTVGGDLDVQSARPIRQTFPVIVQGTASFSATTGSIEMNQGGNDFQGAVNVTSPFGGVTHWIADRNDLILGNIDIVASDFLVQTGMAQNAGLPAATGNLSQTSPLTEPIQLQTWGTSSNILLGAANDINDADPFVLSNPGGGTWGNVTLRNTNTFASALRLNDNDGWTTVGGNLDVQSARPIRQTFPVIVQGTASFSATTGSIEMNVGGNDFRGAVNVTSPFGGVTHWIADRDDLILGNIDVVAGGFLVQTGLAQNAGLPPATGNLSQSVTGTLNHPIQVQTYGTSSDILLGNANDINDGDPFVLSNPGGGTWGNVTLRNANPFASALRLNDNNGWTTVGGDLSVQALSRILQSNPISVGGTSRFETVANPIELTHPNNDFQGVVTLVGGTNVAVFQGVLHDLKVAPLTATQLTLSSGAGIDLSAGTYAASIGPLSLTALAPIELTSGPVTFSGANGISILGAVAGPGALVINQTGTLSSIDVNGSLGTIGAPLGGLTINEAHTNGLSSLASAFVAGDLDVTSAHRILLGGPLSVSGTSRFEANDNVVQLDGSNNFVGVVTVLGGALTTINQNSVNPLRVAPLTTHRLSIESQQSNVALTAGTYEAIFDTVDIAALGGNSIMLGAGTVTLDAANGLTLAGNVEGPGALVLNQRGAGASFSATGTLGTSGARLAGLTIDNASVTGVQLSGSGAFVAGDLNITSAGEIRLGTSAVTGTSRFEAGNAPAVINGDNDFVGLVTMTGSNEVWIAQNSLNPLRVAPLSADFMFFDSQQSNVQLSAGTYEATVGNIRIDTGFPNSIALGAGTVTLDAQNGVVLNGSVAGPGALSIHQRNPGGLISVAGSLGTSAARLGGLTIDDQGTIGMPLGTTQTFVAGDVDITAAGPIQLGAMAVSGTSQFHFQPGVRAGVSIFDPANDFGGVVTVLDGTFVHLSQGSTNPLRVAPLSAENMTIVSWQSDIQLSAGTYQSTVGSLDIGVLGGDAITVGAGTVTLDGANGVSVGGGDVHGPGGLIVHQRNASGYLLSESLGTPGSRLASLAIHNASTNNLSLGSVNATGAVSVETAGDLTLPIGTVVSSSASDIVLAAGTKFVNNAGSGALLPSGRWLVYSTSPADSIEGGLAGAGVRLYNRTYAADPPASIPAGDHLVYVAQPTLAVTANNQSRSYGDANPAFTFSLAGLVSDDGYTDTASDALLTGAATTTATTTSPVAGSPYAITQGTVASGAGYALSFTDGQLTVSPRPITVTADAGQTKVYGNVDPTLGFSITTGNLIGADTLSGALARAAGENVGAYAINQGTLANPNYGITFTGSNFGITQRPIGVTADAGQAKTYGSADPGLTYSITSGSLVGADTLSGALARAAGENVGAYAINQGTLANANYGITFASNNFGVLPAPLTVTADNASRAEGQPNPPFSASYSGFLLGDTAASLGGAIGYATPATTLSAAGNYPVTPFGVTSANYAITFVDGVLTVTPAPVTPPVAVVVEAGRVYLDTLAGIQGTRVAAPLPVAYDRMVTIENGGMRLPEGLKP